MRASRQLGCAWAISAAIMCCSLSAAAQTEAVDPPDFALDLFQGPVLAPARVLALGGAYAGLGEGAAGLVANAASVGTRDAGSVSWLDFDFANAIAAPGLLDDNDFDNSGLPDAEQNSFIYLSAALQLQAGPFGVGVAGDLQRYTVSLGNSDEQAAVIIGRYGALFGGAFLDGQLALGGGLRAVTLGLSAPGTELTMAGFGPQVGMLIRPNWLPFRAGVSYRHRVAASTTIGFGAEPGRNGTIRAGGLQLPSRVELPWELELGVALSVGPRPFNPQWINPHDHEQELRDSYRQRQDERRRARKRTLAKIGDPVLKQQARQRLEQEEVRLRRRDDRALARDLELLKAERTARAENWPRESILLTTELLVTGAVDNAIGLQRFLSQRQRRPTIECQAVLSGASTNFSPRAGVEVEALPGWIRTRFGSYYEPNRFSYAPATCQQHVGRQHFTFGADVRLFTTDWFGLLEEATYMMQTYADIAPRYQNFGLSFGIWR